MVHSTFYEDLPSKVQFLLLFLPLILNPTIYQFDQLERLLEYMLL
nr:MAG TPA: hypothetical protein [Bacteriophage sp.]